MEKNTSKRSAIVHKIAAGAAFAIAAVFLCYAPALRAQADWNTPVNGSLIVADNLKRDPPNCTVNLIDYWVNPTNSATVPSAPVEYADENSGTSDGGIFSRTYGSINRGINAEHYLIFGAQSGAWNKWTNNANTSTSGTFRDVGLDGNGNDTSKYGKAYRGIVNYNLGDDGYPRLALGEYAWLDSVKTDFKNATALGTRSGGANESLAYLFNPDNETDAYSQSARRGYADVKGLFRFGGTSGSANMSGYYWYDSTVNFAELRSSYQGTDFDLYATSTTDKMVNGGEYTMRLYNTPLASGTKYAGQFFPLNYATRDTTNNSLFNISGTSMTVRKTGWNGSGNNYANNFVNHYFGMSMEVEFMQPAGRKVGEGDDKQDMTFTFAGDDDVWIFCDDVLIADLGGNHNALACDINFTTGEIVYYASQQRQAAENDVWRVDYLSNCFGVDLDYGRTAKGWYTDPDGSWVVPANATALQRYYNNTHPWYSGRSGTKLDFTMATTNAWHTGNESSTVYGTFEELTRHTLKFYFLEGGNMSNCMLKFNLSAIAD